jgi:hypothetical protein
MSAHVLALQDVTPSNALNYFRKCKLLELVPNIIDDKDDSNSNKVVKAAMCHVSLHFPDMDSSSPAVETNTGSLVASQHNQHAYADTLMLDYLLKF